MSAEGKTPLELIRVNPRGPKYLPGAVLELHPTADTIIKSEPGTIIWRETLPDGTDAAVKLYRRGLPAWIRSRLTIFRARHELDGLMQLESLGVPCSPPLFWSHGRFGAHGWGEMLATQWVPDSRPLSDVLSCSDPAAMGLDLGPLFASVGRLHDAGLRHGTLLSRNIMLQGSTPNARFVMIDIPRFHRFPRPIRRSRMACYDLLYLCDSLRPHLPVEALTPPLEAYGMADTEQSAFLELLGQFRNTSRLRRVIGAEFNIRHMLSKAF